MIKVRTVSNEDEMEAVFQIRETVFVKEQEVSPKEEYDVYEASSTHFLASVDNQPAGTARWRITENGIKLERFAVLRSLRGKGVGQALVTAVLQDIAAKPESKGKILYLHAQLSAVSLYEKFGFEKQGEQFMECNIAHYTMKKSF